MPLMLRSKSEPTPPSSRIFTPAVRSTRLLSVLSVLAIERTSMAFTDSTLSRSFCVFDFPVTVTSLRATLSRMWLFFGFRVWPFTAIHSKQTAMVSSCLILTDFVFFRTSSRLIPETRGR